MIFVYSEQKTVKEKEAIACLLQKIGNPAHQEMLDRPVRVQDEYRTFPNTKEYPIKQGDTAYFVGVLHSRPWLNHWCAKRTQKIITFSNTFSISQMGKNNARIIEAQQTVICFGWGGRLAVIASRERSLVGLVELWANLRGTGQ